MSLTFVVRAAELPPFNAVVSAAIAGEPLQLAGAGFTGEAWPKGLYAKLGDVAASPEAIELTADVEAAYARAGLAGWFIAFVRSSSRGVFVSWTKGSVTFRVPALGSPVDYMLAVRLAAAAARLAKAIVHVEDAAAEGSPPSFEVAPDELGARYDAKAADAHARRVGTWLVDDMAQERTYWFQCPRGFRKLGPDELGGVERECRFDRARALLTGGSYVDEAPCSDARRKAVLLTAAMIYAAGADGRVDEEEARQLEAHFATVKELVGYAPRELGLAVRAEVSGAEALSELGSTALRRKAFVLAGEVIASAREGKLTGEASDPNVQAINALAKALGLDRDPVFVAEVVRTMMAKYAPAAADDGADTAASLADAMLLAASADGKIDEQEAALLSALSRTVPELAGRDVARLFEGAKTRIANDAESTLAALSKAAAKNKCFTVAAEVALVAGRGPEGTLLPRLRRELAPDDDVADAAIATFAAKYV